MKWSEEQLAAHQAKMAQLKAADVPRLSQEDENKYHKKMKRLSPMACLERELKAEKKKIRNVPNKTEARFEYEILSRIYPLGTPFKFQALTFRLAPDLRYTPDWIVWRESEMTTVEGLLTCYEVKGAHVWDDARVKFLTARELFPWITWQAWQLKGGEWREIWTA